MNTLNFNNIMSHLIIYNLHITLDFHRLKKKIVVSKFIPQARADPLVDRLWPAGHMFATPVLDRECCVVIHMDEQTVPTGL